MEEGEEEKVVVEAVEKKGRRRRKRRKGRRRRRRRKKQSSDSLCALSFESESDFCAGCNLEFVKSVNFLHALVLWYNVILMQTICCRLCIVDTMR